MNSRFGSDAADLQRCSNCGFAASRGDSAWATSGADDPLVVIECPECGSILDVGSHRW